MLTGALLVGPVQAASVGSVCSPPGGQTSAWRPLADLVTDTTGVPTAVEETRIHWTRWNDRVSYGDSAVLEGQVVTEQGAVSEATVDLFAREAGVTGWTPVASASTDPQTGVFSFGCLRPAATTEYRADYAGVLLYYRGSESVKEVQVARLVPDTVTQVSTTRFRFDGAVRPRYSDRSVLLQRKSCSSCSWQTVARRKTTTGSRWSFTIDVSTFTGQRWYRAVVPADERFVRSYSDRVWRFSRG